MRNLQTAWEAIEKGEKVEAQSIVAQILRDDPRNAEAWMVLGEAVSGERQILFLRKALQLNPDLAPAQQRLEQLEAADQHAIDTQADEELLPFVPPDVSLDAPTVAIHDRVNADRSAPQKANGTGPGRKTNKKKASNWGNTLGLIVLALLILVAIFYFIQSLPV